MPGIVAKMLANFVSIDRCSYTVKSYQDLVFTSCKVYYNSPSQSHERIYFVTCSALKQCSIHCARPISTSFVNSLLVLVIGVNALFKVF